MHLNGYTSFPEGKIKLFHPVFFAFVAQRIEQEPSNLLVAGSIPVEGTKPL